jgi:hypothetical protein
MFLVFVRELNYFLNTNFFYISQCININIRQRINAKLLVLELIFYEL